MVTKCRICLKKINLKKDSYVKVTDYKEGKLFDEGFYHNKCYLDRINKGKPLERMAYSLFARANKIMNKIDNEEEVIEFKPNGK